MNILDKIVETKKQELIVQKEAEPEELLMSAPMYGRSCNSLVNELQKNSSSGIIADFK